MGRIITNRKLETELEKEGRSKFMKRFWKYIRPYLSAFIIGPLLMIVEVIGEVLLPKLMANIINVGAANHDVPYIIGMGIFMIASAFLMMVGGLAALILRPRRQSAFQRI